MKSPGRKNCQLTEKEDLFLVNMISDELEGYPFILLLRLWLWLATGDPKIKQMIQLCERGESLRSAYKKVKN